MWSPSTYSRTRKGWPVSDTPASMSSAMWGCFSRPRIRPSRLNRSSPPFPISAILRTFTATRRSNRPSFRPARQFQSARLEKTFLRQHAVLAKQYFQLISQSWALALEGGQPGRALFACHLQRLVKVGTKRLPLIGAELGHIYLDWQVRANIPMEIDACLFPPSLYGTLRQVLQGGDLGKRKPAEKLHINQLGKLRLDFRQFI